MAKDHTPFQALDPDGINRMTMSAYFTRDKQILCIAAAIELEDMATQLSMPINKLARVDLAERLLVIANAQRKLMLDRDVDIAIERQSLASVGVTESVINWCATEQRD